MFDFKALAERAATVTVGGEPVHLKLPSPEQKAAIGAIIVAGAQKDGETDAQSGQRWIMQWSIATGHALHACVPSDPPLTLDEWSALACMDESALKDSGLDVEEFRRLCDASRRLCGLGPMMDAIEDAAAKAAAEAGLDAPDTDEGTQDHITDAADAAGNSPSS